VPARELDEDSDVLAVAIGALVTSAGAVAVEV
jgi:hypothetical protein